MALVPEGFAGLPTVQLEFGRGRTRVLTRPDANHGAETSLGNRVVLAR
jgi:hypothetical protein